MVRSRWLWLSVVFMLAAGVLPAAAQDLATFVPREASVYVMVDLSLQNPSMQRLGLSLAADPQAADQLRKAVASGLQSLRELFAEGKIPLDPEKDLLGWMDGRVAAGLLPFTPQQAQAPGFVPEFVVIVGAENPAAARAALAKFPVKTRSHAGQTVADFGEYPPLSVAVVNSVVVLGPPAMVDRTIDTIFGRHSSLATASPYIRSRERLSGEPLLRLFVRLDFVRQLLQDAVGKEGPAGPAAALTPLENFDGVALTVSAAAEGLRLDCAVHGRLAIQNPLFAAWASHAPLNLDALQFFPADSLFAFAFTDPKLEWKQIVQTLSSIEPETRSAINSFMAELKKETGIALEEDVLDWMTGAFAVGLFGLRPGPVSVQPAGAVVIESADPRSVDALLGKVRAALRKMQIPVAEVAVDSQSALQVTLGPLPIGPVALARVDRYLVLATNTQALEQALAARRGGKGLPASERFREAMAAAPERPLELLYADVGRALQAIVALRSPSEGEFVAAIGNALKTIGAATTVFPDGWYSAAVLGLDYPNLWKLAQVLAPAIEQARERARRRARRAECASNMRQLGLAAHLYAADHEGRLPPADNWVEALQPYFQNRDILRCPDAPGQPVAYAFNSRAAGQRIEDLPTDMVLFFETSKNESSPADAGTSVAVRHPGGANYAFVDGHVIVSREPPRFAP